MHRRGRIYSAIILFVAALGMAASFSSAVAAEPPYFSSPTQISKGYPRQRTNMEDNIIFTHASQAIIWATIDPDAPDDAWRKGIQHSYVSYRAAGQTDWSTETETIFISNPGFIDIANWVCPVQYIAANGVYEIKLISEDADGLRCEEVYTIEVDTDSDQDGYADVVDNCPGTPNPGQQDADSDGIGDACDADTIYGYISGEVTEGIDVNIAIVTDSMRTIIATLITDEDGYYAIGDLEDNWYQITPEYNDHIFTPNSAPVQISTAP